MARRLERGRATRYVILGVLNTFGPLSGYGVKRMIAQTIDFMWSESFGQLYPELKRLAKDRLVRRVSERHDNPRGRKTFEITGSGRRALSAWLRQPPARELVRVEHLVKLFFSRAAGVKASRLQVLAAREKSQARLAQFAAIRAQIESVAEASPDFVNWMLVLRSGEMQAEMRVRWADEALALLDAWERGGAKAVLTTSRAQRGYDENRINSAMLPACVDGKAKTRRPTTTLNAPAPRRGRHFEKCGPGPR